jgi:hypothetical protein
MAEPGGVAGHRVFDAAAFEDLAARAHHPGTRRQARPVEETQGEAQALQHPQF